ncbi:MAG: hypothetical protein HOI56_05115 [Gammaproteobacteria bacterium]|nr:hypothetical protein [Gammaproteobacteria bacterium]MBT4462362.1 hypothetical protein [Gammaproteobacteria bacterium]MBT4655289.1 hypothetical protein [Gammaproteobacteria bacterium]MBT5117215.1 hypothetical protein [Gammaproteobacteria bacterium]MBT5762104.1 hypothetical protein [Gammaproteobacteria bacterium]
MDKLYWLDNGLWEYYTQELDRILCGTIKHNDHNDLVAIYSHYIYEKKVIPIQLQEYINLYSKNKSIDSSSQTFYKKDEYINLILIVCVRLKESYGENRTNAIGLVSKLFDTDAESIFKMYEGFKDKADAYISVMPNMREISNFLDKHHN